MSQAAGKALLPWLALALLWFGPLNAPHLFDPDEGRYAEIPREMLASGDWVTPRLDAIKYFEKPALQYWTTAAAMRLFGQNPWSVRLWPALCGFLGLLLTFSLTRALFGLQSAALAVIVQASALLYFGMARIATLDMSVCFGLQLALYALALLARRGARATWKLGVLLGVGVAVAVLSKGLIGILIPGTVAVLYVIWTRDFALLLRAQPWWSLLALILLAAPWFVLVSVRNPEFAHFFFVVQHFQRYLSTQGIDRYQPVWFFVPVLLLGLLPWSTLLPGALREAWRAAREDARAGAGASAMLLIWALFVFAFFSLSQSKLIPYIVPMLPALAVLIGHHIGRLQPQRLARHLRAIAVFAAALGLAVLLSWRLPVAATLVTRASSASIAGFAAAFLLLAAGAACGVRWARRQQPIAAATLAGLGACLMGVCGLLAADKLPRMQALVDLEQYTRPSVGNSTRIYCVNDYLQPLPFYWRQPCTLVGYRGELDFGLNQEPWRWIPNLQQFASAWREQSDALAIVSPEDYQKLVALGLPMHVLYTGHSLIAVVRR